MRSRREFLLESTITALGAGSRWRAHAAEHVSELLASLPPCNAETLAQDEGFWHRVRGAFVLEPSLINLNHGLSPSPRAVLEAFARDIDRVNRAPLLHLIGPHEGRREEVRARAAVFLGCDAEELAITRSATEALQIIQLGLELGPGDEVLSTNEDYWAMWNTWQQRVHRDGITYSEVKFSPPYPAPEEIVARFEQAITPRTRALLFCHMTWLTGHVLPVRDICVMARSKGVRTIVDGAHAVAHIPFRLRDLECDYYGSCGHKWLQAPLGTGFLYVRREHIRDLWPLTPAWEKVREDIRKFEWVGSSAPAAHNAIADALDFQQRLGVERKAARLHYLKRRWAERLGRHPAVRILTDLTLALSCGIGAFAIEGIEPETLARYLLERHRILVFAFGKDEYDGPPGIRVAPQVYTSAPEIDRFSEVVESVLRTGLPSPP